MERMALHGLNCYQQGKGLSVQQTFLVSGVWSHLKIALSPEIPRLVMSSGVR